MTYLLDANVLISLCNPQHGNFPAALTWIEANPSFATCPITEGALIRLILQQDPGNVGAVRKTLGLLSKYHGFEFWPCDLPYRNVNLERIFGHKQVTDAYLVDLARAHDGRLATFDRALVTVHPEAILVPVG